MIFGILLLHGTTALNVYTGSCHCKKVKVSLTTEKSREELYVRRCPCDFCVKHGAYHTADPDGQFRVEGDVQKYRFGLKTADFLICPHCGTYVGAVFPAEDKGSYAVVNVKILDDYQEWPQPTEKSFKGEDKTARHARRLRTWTPVS